jgi:DNA-binding CsgD family transcriptional regulator
MLRRVLGHVKDDDVRLFYAYFDELKAHVRRYLGYKARKFPGSSAVAQSALFSLFCDLALQQVCLSDVDEHGYPALWPLLLKYLERHCNKWKKYYQALKRRAVEVPQAAIDPPDPRGDEGEVGAALEALYARLTLRQRRVAELTAEGHTLAEVAAALGCSQSLVSLEKKIIRELLETD